MKAINQKLTPVITAGVIALSALTLTALAENSTGPTPNVRAPGSTGPMPTAPLPGSTGPTVTAPAPGSTGPVRMERHPAIHAAINALERAKVELQHADHDFGGHRAAAVAECEKALRELRLALEFDKK